MQKLYDKYVASLDPKFIAKEIKSIKGYMFTRTNSVIEWMASPYVGAHLITFRDAEVNRLFYTFDIDPKGFKHDLIATLKEKATWNVLSNHVNIILLLLAYRMKNNEEVFKDIIAILYFKFTTSTYSHYFAELFSTSTAKMVYNNTSNQALIKQYGNNHGVMYHVADRCYKESALAVKFNKISVDNINYILSDISGTVRNVGKLSYRILERADNVSHTESTSLVTNEGVESTTVNHNEHVELKERLMSVDGTAGFKSPRLVKLIVSSYSESLTEEMLNEAIDILIEVDNKKEFYESVIDAFIIYLSKSNYYPPYDKSFMNYVATARGYINSSKTTDSSLLSAKLFIAENVTPKMTVKRTAVLAANCLLLYCFTLAIYQGRL